MQRVCVGVCFKKGGINDDVFFLLFKSIESKTFTNQHQQHKHVTKSTLFIYSMHTNTTKNSCSDTQEDRLIRTFVSTIHYNTIFSSRFCLQIWKPILPKSKLMVYLRAARSITSFNGYCETEDGCPEKALNALSEDQNTAHSYNVVSCLFDVKQNITY